MDRMEGGSGPVRRWLVVGVVEGHLATMLRSAKSLMGLEVPHEIWILPENQTPWILDRGQLDQLVADWGAKLVWLSRSGKMPHGMMPDAVVLLRRDGPRSQFGSRILSACKRKKVPLVEMREEPTSPPPSTSATRSF